ncbi:MAG: hypothetical protein MJ211_14015 [Bacteroidales bacterium]|nr:hypothetical protein [Bacteroidales bacterium]
MTLSLQKILSVFQDNNYIVSAKVLKDNGFDRYQVEQYLQDEILLKVGYGLYCLKDNVPDEFSMIQSRSEKIIFSHSTALYLLGMSDRVPGVFNVTIPQGYNVTKIKRDFDNIDFNYSKADWWSLGVSKVATPQGFEVSVYDKERSILDIIRNKSKVDYQIYIQAIKEYFSTQKNFRKILKYSKVMNLEDKVRMYIEMI